MKQPLRHATKGSLILAIVPKNATNPPDEPLRSWQSQDHLPLKKKGGARCIALIYTQSLIGNGI